MLSPIVYPSIKTSLSSNSARAASITINMFYKQIILQGGLPFDVKLPKTPLDTSKMTKEEIDAELEKGYRNIVEGRTASAEDVFKQHYEKYGI